MRPCRLRGSPMGSCLWTPGECTFCGGGRGRPGSVAGPWRGPSWWPVTWGEDADPTSSPMWLGLCRRGPAGGLGELLSSETGQSAPYPARLLGQRGLRLVTWFILEEQPRTWTHPPRRPHSWWPGSRVRRSWAIDFFSSPVGPKATAAGTPGSLPRPGGSGSRGKYLQEGWV